MKLPAAALTLLAGIASVAVSAHEHHRHHHRRAATLRASTLRRSLQENATVANAASLSNDIGSNASNATVLPENNTATIEPTATLTASPTLNPTIEITSSPSLSPTATSSESPSVSPTDSPTLRPTTSPSHVPSASPSFEPTTCVASGDKCELDEDGNAIVPCCSSDNTCFMLQGLGGRCVTTDEPFSPTVTESESPSALPSAAPTGAPTSSPSTLMPTAMPSKVPTPVPSSAPTFAPTTMEPTTMAPSASPTKQPVSEPPTIFIEPIPELVTLGENPELEEGQHLQMCEGDCDSDEDCSALLVCFQRTDTELIPGCVGAGVEGWDYCSKTVVEEDKAEGGDDDDKKGNKD